MVASALHGVFQATGKGLDDAIKAWREAPQEDPATRYGLALALLDRGDTDEARELLEGVLRDAPPRSASRPAYMNALARASDPADDARLSREACELGLEVSLEGMLFTGDDWGGRASARGAWAEAGEAYGYAIRALQRLVGPQAQRAAKLDWLRRAPGIAANSAYALAHTDPGAAVVALEGTRGLQISEARGIERFPLDGLPPELAERFRTAVDRWGTAAREGGELQPARVEIETVIGLIQRLPGYERFLAYPSLEDVLAATDDPLVYLVAATAGGVALVVTDHVEPIWLPRLTEAAVRERANAFVAAYEHRHTAREAWADELDALGRWLWPVMERVLTRERVVIVACGLLGLLPLHAAWTEDASRPPAAATRSTTAVISYASTANALLLAHEPAVLDGVLTVVEPDPVFLPALANADAEAAVALAAFAKRIKLAGPQARSRQVVPALVETPVVHFACHALSSLREPHRSGIVLAGDRLLDPFGLARLPLGRLRLAILSACETAVYGAQAPDEAIGLPSAFVEAGVGGVLASLWEVLDAGAMILLARFYELWRAEGHSVPEALVARPALAARHDQRGKEGALDRGVPARRATGGDLRRGHHRPALPRPRGARFRPPARLGRVHVHRRGLVASRRASADRPARVARVRGGGRGR